MIIVQEIKSLTEFPPNSILITYSDHYRMNKGDDIFLTNASGELANKSYKDYFNHFHNNLDDRGMISIKALSHEDGAFAVYHEFSKLCYEYVEASYNLKKWDDNEVVYLPKTIILTDEINSISKLTTKKENHDYLRDLLVKNKEEAKKWFDDNNISVRNAYNFTNGYIK